MIVRVLTVLVFRVQTMGVVWFLPKIVLPKFSLANILVELFLAHKLAYIG
jgi:hypothetical protein